MSQSVDEFNDRVQQVLNLSNQLSKLMSKDIKAQKDRDIQNMLNNKGLIEKTLGIKLTDDQFNDGIKFAKNLFKI